MRQLLVLWLLFFSVPGNAWADEVGHIPEDPISSLYRRIQVGMSHVEVNRVLGKPEFNKYHWEIHPSDLREREDIWMPDFHHYVRNIFSENGYLSSDLFIYFIGTKVACVFYRFWGDNWMEANHRGDCHAFAEN